MAILGLKIFSRFEFFFFLVLKFTTIQLESNFFFLERLELTDFFFQHTPPASFLIRIILAMNISCVSIFGVCVCFFKLFSLYWKFCIKKKVKNFDIKKLVQRKFSTGKI